MKNSSIYLDTCSHNRPFDDQTQQLGNINAERFVSILLHEPFDYTEWRKNNLCAGMTVEEISKEAMEIYKENL
jgi:hypothetical protein